MMKSLYYCTNASNTCLKKDECERFVDAEGNCNTTLYKESCTEQNNYILFIKNEQKEGENSSC